MASITKDKFIQSKIQSKILFTKELSSMDLEVEVFFGEVYIIGLVAKEELMQKVVDIAKNTDGVTKINTYLRVKQEKYPCSSIEVLAQLKKELLNDKATHVTNIRVAVAGCDVVFTGVVDSIEQEKHAIWFAKHIENVGDVYSYLKVVKK